MNCCHYVLQQTRNIIPEDNIRHSAAFCLLASYETLPQRSSLSHCHYELRYESKVILCTSVTREKHMIIQTSKENQ